MRPHNPRASYSSYAHGPAGISTIRAFVSVELPHTARLLLHEEIFLLRKAGGRASWVRPEHLHLTLRFLGEITQEQKEAFSRHLRDLCANTPPMQLAVEGFGAFPNVRKPAVIWAGIRQVAGDLAGLQQKIEQAALGIGLDPDNKPFHPHVTLARIRELAGAAGLVQAVKDRADGPVPVFGDEFQAAAVALFRSDLKPGGPEHTRLEEFPLSCKSCS
jgi:2'-5' RNA ligase